MAEENNDHQLEESDVSVVIPDVEVKGHRNNSDSGNSSYHSDAGQYTNHAYKHDYPVKDTPNVVLTARRSLRHKQGGHEDNNNKLVERAIV